MSYEHDYTQNVIMHDSCLLTDILSSVCMCDGKVLTFLSIIKIKA